MTDAHDWPVIDLRTVIDLGLERGGHLLTAGELQVARTILALDGAPARLYARLLERKPDTFHLPSLTVPGVDDVRNAVAFLHRSGLTDGLVPWPVRAERVTRDTLVDACRRLGLRRSGRRAELAARVAEHRGWLTGRWVRLRHTGLVQRLQTWAFLRRNADRRTFVVERLGRARWPEYAKTPGPGLWRQRAAHRAWARLAAGGGTPDQAVEGMISGECWGPGHLDLSRRLVTGVCEVARDLERSGHTAEARRLYRRLTDEAGVPRSRLAFRIARTLEGEGRGVDALSVLQEGRRHATPEQRVGLARSGRRLARSVGGAWPPGRPLRAARVRSLTLAPGPATHRPTWLVGERTLQVEAAVAATVERSGRVAIRAEGPLWATLTGLLLADTWFAPVPGALPMDRLTAPLDLGSAAFCAARAPLLDSVARDIRDGGAVARLAEVWKRRRGERLRGVRWTRWSLLTLTAIVDGLSPPALNAILRAFAENGPRGARGLPDLVVLPGPATALPVAWPSRLPPKLLLVEVKGPGDSLRDAQIAWIDILLRAGGPVEVWEIRPGQRSADHAQRGVVSRTTRR
ncbi:MAG: hypothetical protein ACI8PZ_004842 [Myxococcota bacterium]